MFQCSSLPFGAFAAGLFICKKLRFEFAVVFWPCVRHHISIITTYEIFSLPSFLMSLCCTFFLLLSFFSPLSDLEIVAFMGKLKTLLRHSIQLNKNQFYPDNGWMPWSWNVEMTCFFLCKLHYHPPWLTSSYSLKLWKWWSPCPDTLTSVLLNVSPGISGDRGSLFF